MNISEETFQDWKQDTERMWAWWPTRRRSRLRRLLAALLLIAAAALVGGCLPADHHQVCYINNTGAHVCYTPPPNV